MRSVSYTHLDVYKRQAYTDLMGREVVDERFGSLGTIVEIMSTPANDVWVVEGDRYGEVLIPVIEQVVLDLPDTGTISVHVMEMCIRDRYNPYGGIVRAPRNRWRGLP